MQRKALIFLNQVPLSTYLMNDGKLWTYLTSVSKISYGSEYSALRFVFHVPPVQQISYNVFDGLENESLELDSIAHRLNLSWDVIEIDIAISPSFLIPTPFLRAFDHSTGSYLTLNKIANIITIEVGNFIQTEHPLENYPCYSIHICEIPSLMALMQQSMGKTSELVDSKASSLLLLHWFSIVGQTIQLPLSTKFFKFILDIETQSV
jgi:hypothetical protein